VPATGVLDQPLADVTGAALPVTGVLDQPLADVTAATGPATGVLDQPLADVTGAALPVTGVLDQPLVDVAAATGPVTGVLDQPLVDVTGAVAPVTGAFDQPFAALEYPDVGAFGGHEASLAVPPLDPGDLAGGTTAPMPPADLFATDGGGISLPQLLGTGYVTWKLAVLGVALASLTHWYGNATGCFRSVRLVAFTNVELIRCGFVSPIVRMTTSSVVAAGQALGLGGTGAGVSPVQAIGIGHARSTHPIATGSTRTRVAVQRAVRHTLDGESGLMMRIGKLLALAYAGFLAVWVWATRVRWNGKS
jgi:hypothetical protein